MDLEQLMNSEKKRALNESRVELCENLDNIEIIAHLKQHGMRQHNAEEIMSVRLTRFQQNDQLITWLTNRTNGDFEAFCKALDTTGQSYLKNIIVKKLSADSMQEATLEVATLSSMHITTTACSRSQGASAGCTKPGYIVVAGGHIMTEDNQESQRKDCYAYSIETDKWITLPQIPFPFKDIVTCDGKVYAVGIQYSEDTAFAYGTIKREDIRYSLKIMELSMTKNEWNYRQDISSTYCNSCFEGYSLILPAPPNIVAASVNREDLYVYRYREGDDRGHFDKLDRNLQWTKLASPSIAILSMVDLDGMPFARSHHKTDKLHAYNPTTNKWSHTAPMRRTMKTAKLVASNSRLYVLGGDDEERGSCLSYNPGRNEWTDIQPMLRICFSCTAASDGTRLFVVGGRDGEHQLIDDVEVYNPDEDKWTSVAKYPLKIQHAKATFVEELV